MLDTNIISDMVKHPGGSAARRGRAVQEQLYTSIIVASELRYGCAKKSSRELLQKVEDILDEIGVLALDMPAGTDCGSIAANWKQRANPSGPMICSLRRTLTA